MGWPGDAQEEESRLIGQPWHMEALAYQAYGGPGIRHGIVIRRPRHMSIPAYGGFGIRRFTILGSNLMHPDLRSRCTAVGMTGLDLTATS